MNKFDGKNMKEVPCSHPILLFEVLTAVQVFGIHVLPIVSNLLHPLGELGLIDRFIFFLLDWEP